MKKIPKVLSYASSKYCIQAPGPAALCSAVALLRRAGKTRQEKESFLSPQFRLCAHISGKSPREGASFLKFSFDIFLVKKYLS